MVVHGDAVLRQKCFQDVLAVRLLSYNMTRKDELLAKADIALSSLGNPLVQPQVGAVPNTVRQGGLSLGMYGFRSDVMRFRTAQDVWVPMVGNFQPPQTRYVGNIRLRIVVEPLRTTNEIPEDLSQWMSGSIEPRDETDEEKSLHNGIMRQTMQRMRDIERMRVREAGRLYDPATPEPVSEGRGGEERSGERSSRSPSESDGSHKGGGASPPAMVHILQLEEQYLEEVEEHKLVMYAEKQSYQCLREQYACEAWARLIPVITAAPASMEWDVIMEKLNLRKALLAGIPRRLRHVGHDGTPELDAFVSGGTPNNLKLRGAVSWSDEVSSSSSMSSSSFSRRQSELDDAAARNRGRTNTMPSFSPVPEDAGTMAGSHRRHTGEDAWERRRSSPSTGLVLASPVFPSSRARASLLGYVQVSLPTVHLVHESSSLANLALYRIEVKCNLPRTAASSATAAGPGVGGAGGVGGGLNGTRGLPTRFRKNVGGMGGHSMLLQHQTRWFVFRRYNEFEALIQYVTGECGEAGGRLKDLIPSSPKSLRSVFSMTMTSEFLEERRVTLERTLMVLLQAVQRLTIASKDAALTLSTDAQVAVMDFLGFAPKFHPDAEAPRRRQSTGSMSPGTPGSAVARAVSRTQSHSVAWSPGGSPPPAPSPRDMGSPTPSLMELLRSADASTSPPNSPFSFSPQSGAKSSSGGSSSSSSVGGGGGGGRRSSVVNHLQRISDACARLVFLGVAPPHQHFRVFVWMLLSGTVRRIVLREDASEVDEYHQICSVMSSYTTAFTERLTDADGDVAGVRRGSGDEEGGQELMFDDADDEGGEEDDEVGDESNSVTSDADSSLRRKGSTDSAEPSVENPFGINGEVLASCLDQIDLDIMRTKVHKVGDVDEAEALRRVLRTFVVKRSRIGYCQAMNYVALFLLRSCDGCEEHALSLLLSLADNVVTDYWSPSMLAVQADMRVLNQLVRECLPLLWGHFEEIRLPLDLFATQWLVSLFSYALPPHTTARVWDWLMLDGPTVLLCVVLALLRRTEGILLANDDLQSCAEILQKAANDSHDADELIYEARAEFHNYEATIGRHMKDLRHDTIKQVKDQIESIARRKRLKQRAVQLLVRLISEDSILLHTYVAEANGGHMLLPRHHQSLDASVGLTDPDAMPPAMVRHPRSRKYSLNEERIKEMNGTAPPNDSMAVGGAPGSGNRSASATAPPPIEEDRAGETSEATEAEVEDAQQNESLRPRTPPPTTGLYLGASPSQMALIIDHLHKNFKRVKGISPPDQIMTSVAAKRKRQLSFEEYQGVMEPVIYFHESTQSSPNRRRRSGLKDPNQVLGSVFKAFKLQDAEAVDWHEILHCWVLLSGCKLEEKLRLSFMVCDRGYSNTIDRSDLCAFVQYTYEVFSSKEMSKANSWKIVDMVFPIYTPNAEPLRRIGVEDFIQIVCDQPEVIDFFQLRAPGVQRRRSSLGLGLLGTPSPVKTKF